MPEVAACSVTCYTAAMVINRLREEIAVVLLLLALCVVFGAGYLARARRLRRAEFIGSYVFPSHVLSGLTKRYPDIGASDQLRVVKALREFFLIRLRVGDRLIGMPSRVVDDLWHEFILDTREYERFCKSAFGRFFHHVPAAANPPDKKMGAALRATWRYACLAEHIFPGGPTRLPLLFAIDTELQIADGQSFVNWLFAPPRHVGAGGGGGCAGGCSGHSCGGHGGCGGH
jgi:hypothetical protein